MLGRRVMANFKGTIFESVRMFTERRFGPEANDRLLAEMSAEDRDLLNGLNALGWYPSEPIMRYHHTLDRVFGSGDLDLCLEAGRFSAGWAMNTVLKVFLRFRSPNWLIERATSVWGRYHDTGRWVITTATDTRLQGELFDFAVRDPAFCARLRGWLLGAVELTGGERCTVIETMCVNRGHDRCQFTIQLRK
jgi:hypothetical protein